MSLRFILNVACVESFKSFDPTGGPTYGETEIGRWRRGCQLQKRMKEEPVNAAFTSCKMLHEAFTFWLTLWFKFSSSTQAISLSIGF